MVMNEPPGGGKSTLFTHDIRCGCWRQDPVDQDPDRVADGAASADVRVADQEKPGEGRSPEG